MIKENVLKMIDAYVDNYKIEDKEFYLRIQQMYYKEFEHIVDMQKRATALKNITLHCMNFLNSYRIVKDFDEIKALETDEDFFNYTVKSVNDVIAKFWRHNEDN